MDIIRLNELEQVKTPKGVYVRNLINQSEVAVINVILKAGEVLPVHSTPVDVFFYIYQGSGSVIIGEESAEVEQGELIVSPRNIPHGLIAGDEDFSVLVVKTPNPKA